MDFFLSYQTRCRSIGIECDERIFKAACKNGEDAVSTTRAEFILENAEKYIVPIQTDRCYFFNPFSVEILKKVLARIMESYYQKPRQILLFFYYPSDEYIAYLMTHDTLMFYDEIDCDDLFPGKNNRERILIFEIL